MQITGDTMAKLDIYEFQLSRLKHTYHKLSSEMNRAALSKTAREQVRKQANDAVG